MKLHEVKDIARQKGIREVALKNLKKNELVRAIQASEGNLVCFNAGYVDICGQSGCLWREDCLKDNHCIRIR